MKKNVLIYIIILIITYFIFNNQLLIVNTVISSSILFITKILPFFLPMYIISKVLINYNFPYFISKIFNNNIYVYILILSFISGSPNNVILIKDLLDKNIINIDEANKYIKCSFFQNPLFLYSMLSNIFNTRIAITFIIGQLLSNIIIFIIKPISNNNISKVNSINISDLLVNTINESINVLLTIYITIIVFSIIVTLIPNYLSNFIGLFEITNGLNYLITCKCSFIIKIILANIYLSFGGLAVHLQIKSVIKDTSILYSNFLLSRFYSAFILHLILLLASTSLTPRLFLM